MDKQTKSTYITAAVFLVFLLVAVYFLFIFKKGPAQIKPKDSESFDVKQISEIEVAKRPFVTLTPTANGAEIIISIENMKEFERVEYELTYQADNPSSPGTKIERGAVGSDVNTKDEKYKKSVLLGTASRGVSSPDVGIADGKLTMHLFKGSNEYLSESNWDLLQSGLKPTSLKSRDGNFQITVPGLGKDYWVILADTVGVPAPAGKFEIKNVSLPVYGVFSVANDFTKSGEISLKASTEVEKPQIMTFNHNDNSWQNLQSDFNSTSKTVTAVVNKFATFVLVSSK